MLRAWCNRPGGLLWHGVVTACDLRLTPLRNSQVWVQNRWCGFFAGRRTQKVQPSAVQMMLVP